MVPTQPNNQWGAAQFWDYVKTVHDLTQQELINDGHTEYKHLVLPSILNRMLDAAPAGNA